MAKGRPPKHPNLHVIRGTHRADRHGPIQELVGIKLAENLQPPDFLDAYARDQWKEVVPQLEALGILAEIDAHLLAMYCSQLSIYRQCERELESDESVTVQMPGGTKRKNPCLSIMKDCIETTTKLAALFGVGPMSRVKLQQAIPLNSQKPKPCSLLDPRSLLD